MAREKGGKFVWMSPLNINLTEEEERTPELRESYLMESLGKMLAPPVNDRQQRQDGVEARQAERERFLHLDATYRNFWREGGYIYFDKNM